MNKIVQIFLSQFPKDVNDIIYEYARDDSKKKEFLKSYDRLFYAWTAIGANPIMRYHKRLMLVCCEPSGTLSIRFMNGKHYDTENMKYAYLANIDAHIFFDHNFFIKKSVPKGFIWNQEY